MQLNLWRPGIALGNAFFPCFWANDGQPIGQIDWATLMPFTSINYTDPRTNLSNFYKKYWELAILKNIVILNQPSWFFFPNNFFALFPWTQVKVYWLARMGQNFDQAKHDNTSWLRPNILTGSVTFHLSKDLWIYGQNTQIFKCILFLGYESGINLPYLGYTGMINKDLWRNGQNTSKNCKFWKYIVGELLLHPKAERGVIFLDHRFL